MQETVQMREGVQQCTFSPGLQLAQVKAIRKVRDENDNIVTNQAGDILIEIVFGNNQNQTGSIAAYANEKNQWVFDKLCNCARVNNYTKSTSTKEVIGKWLYVVCAGVIKVVDGVMEEKPYRSFLKQKFFLYSPGIPKPALPGDPTMGGSLSGDFLHYEIYEEKKQSKENHNEREFGDL